MSETSSARIPLWLDCDPGHDDAFAILLAAHHPSLALLGISTVHGNASLAHTTANALAVLEAIGKCDINVFPGTSKPFCREANAAPEIHGESGLDGTDLLPKPERKALTHCNAVTEMRDALMSTEPNTAWLVTTGTMTNAALMFSIYPEIAGHIKGLSIMGGAVGNSFTAVSMGPDFIDPSSGAEGVLRPRIGNWSPYAEFNIWCDPESAQSIFSNSTLRPKTWLIPLDVTHQAYATKPIQDFLLWGGKKRLAQKPPCSPSSIPTNEKPTRLRKMFNELLMFFAKTYSDQFGLSEGPPLHDPLAVAVLLHDHSGPAVRIPFSDNIGERYDINTVLEGNELGRTVVSPTNGNGSIVPRTLDLQAFWKTLEMCMERADKATGYKSL